MTDAGGAHRSEDVIMSSPQACMRGGHEKERERRIMKSIYKALADFQQECPIIHKGTKGYGYTYADLPAIFERCGQPVEGIQVVHLTPKKL